MNDQLFAAAWRPQTLVSRVDELETIRQAIYSPKCSCEVILITGRGGLGKSRLVEEVLWRGGNAQARRDLGPIPPARLGEWDWTRHGNALVSDLIDLTEIRLHTRSRFMRAIRDALTGQDGADFTHFDAAHSRQQHLREQQTEFSIIHDAAQQTEIAFLKDYRAAAAQRRIVLSLDTAEELAIISSKWLLERGLIEPKELTFNTQHWLADQIRAGSLPNTTLLLAGRDEEGGPFFNEIRKAASEAGDLCELTPVLLKNFNLENTRVYFQTLVQDWERRASAPDVLPTARLMKRLAEDHERINVLWLYTGGQPVRLSLYADLIVEGSVMPEPLGDSFERAKDRVKTDDPINAPTPGLKDVRQEIEGEFITLLFAQPSLRSDILRALVRARRGLNEHQLHYVLDSRPGAKPADWKATPGRVEAIKTELEAMRYLSIIKRRADGVALQDEIYRIYADHMSADERSCQDEMKARQQLYAQLRDWARHEQHQLEQKRKGFQADDERRLRFESPTRALEVHFPYSLEVDEERIQVRVRDLELDCMHYALLLDLDRNFNEAYFNLADEWWRANDEEAGALAQAEMWRVLYDEYALKFIDLKSRPALERRGETPLIVLRRAARQEDVSRWIKRFVLRREYQRAVDFCDQVEAAIGQLTDPKEKRSWSHTLAWAERLCWREYARILQGQEIPDALKKMEDAASTLVKLAKQDQNTPVFSEREECGFIGHPAELRLNRVIVTLYNYLGYGNAMLWRFRKAACYYGLALKYMRETEFVAQHATTLNNLSRPLSKMGRGARARRLCLDGLARRKQQGADIPIAMSMSTLALIDNDLRRPDRAWIEAATALAYFRRAEDLRGQGLALIHLGEALRRLAHEVRAGRVLPVPPDPVERIYDEAETALEQALGIFLDSPAAAESPRSIEAKIEMGCLQRDRIRIIDRTLYPDQWRRRYNNALQYLTSAAEGAKNLDHVHFQLDAQVNIAWTYYYALDFGQAALALQEAEKLLPLEGRLIVAGQPLPQPGENGPEPYVFYQLSKISGLRGRMAMDAFRSRAETIETENPQADRPKRHQLIDDDIEAQNFLKQAADEYVRALGYAQLFSVRSSALLSVYDTLYDCLKKFNAVEIKRFFQYERAARQRYDAGAIRGEDLGNLDVFLVESFGSYDLEGNSYDS